MSDATTTLPTGASVPDTFARSPRTSRDVLTMAARSLRLSARNVDALFTSTVLPVVIMLMFVYLFGGAIQTQGAYVDYVFPGVLLLCVGFVSALTATTVTQDMQEGIIDRFRSMDVAGGSVLAGHVAASLARNGVSAVAMVAVAVLVGFRAGAGPGEWLAAIGLVVLFVIAMSWLSVTFGLVARSAEGASGFAFVVMFLPYPSSAFVPVDTMPTWLQGFAEHQPVTPVIDSLRGLLIGTPIGGDLLVAVAWCAAITVGSIAASAALFRRRVT